MIGYLRNCLASFSHVLNAFTGGLPRYSFSARVGSEAYLRREWALWVEALVDVVLFNPGHCREEARKEGLI